LGGVLVLSSSDLLRACCTQDEEHHAAPGLSNGEEAAAGSSGGTAAGAAAAGKPREARPSTEQLNGGGVDASSLLRAGGSGRNFLPLGVRFVLQLRHSFFLPILLIRGSVPSLVQGALTRALPCPCWGILLLRALPSFLLLLLARGLAHGMHMSKPEPW
jgi:hypothetical protein